MKNILVLIYFFLSLKTTAINTEEYWLFVGNPGAGKSTIINSLLKQRVAEAGSSDDGGGVTKKCALYQNGNIVYIDTPGLDDINTRVDAAKEIEKSLKQDGKYRIFFIIKTDNLRIRPADLETIDIVLDAINLQNIEYNIIINQLTGKDAKVFYSNSDTIESSLFYSYFQSGKYKNNNKIRFIPMDVNVLQGNKDFIDFEPEMMEFLSKSSAIMHIPQNCIKNVDTESKEKKLKKSIKKFQKISYLIKETRDRTETAEREIDEIMGKNKDKLMPVGCFYWDQNRIDSFNMKWESEPKQSNSCIIF